MSPEKIEDWRPIATGMAADLLDQLDRSIDIGHLVEIAILTGMAFMENQARMQFDEIQEAAAIEANRRDLIRPRRRHWAR